MGILGFPPATVPESSRGRRRRGAPKTRPPCVGYRHRHYPVFSTQGGKAETEHHRVGALDLDGTGPVCRCQGSREVQARERVLY